MSGCWGLGHGCPVLCHGSPLLAYVAVLVWCLYVSTLNECGSSGRCCRSRVYRFNSRSQSAVGGECVTWQCGLTGIRVGEARVPGPAFGRWDIWTVNATSVSTQGSKVVAWAESRAEEGCLQVGLVSEAGVTVGGAKKFTRLASDAGFMVHWGRVRQAGGWLKGGLCLVVTKGINAGRVDDGELCDAAEQGRAAIFQFGVGAGRMVCIIGVYAHASDPMEREALIATVFATAESMRQRYSAVLVMGDLNTGNSPHVALALARGWRDVGAPGPTTQAGSRIDHIIGCATAGFAWQASESVDLRVPVHLAVRAQFDWEVAKQQVRRVVKPRAYILNGEERKLCEVSGALGEVIWAGVSASEAEWNEALDGGPEVAYRLLMNNFEAWLTEVTGKGGRAFEGRGVPHSDLIVWMMGKYKPAGTQCAELRLEKARRRLSELHTKQTRLGWVTWEMAEMWRKTLPQVRRVMSDNGWVPTASVPAPFVVGQVVQAIQEEIVGAQRKDVRDRAKMWDKIVEEEKRGLYKWLSADQMPVRGIVVEKQDGTMTGNVSEAHQLIFEAWGKYLQRYLPGRGEVPPDFVDFYLEYGVYVTKANHQADWGRITVEKVDEGISRMKDGSQSGVDGCTVAEFKAMPIRTRSRVADILNIVEGTGQWPDATIRALISMLDKGAGRKPLKLRPISVTALLYRLWAGIRSREWAEWLETLDLPEGIFGGRKGRSAIVMGWIEAAEIEIARMRSKAVAAGTLDLEKCYDSVPRKLAIELARFMGVPEGVLCAISGFYSQLLLQFRLETTVGNRFSGDGGGLLQGCALSSLLLMGLMATWARYIEHKTECRPSVYIDDARVRVVDHTHGKAAVRRVVDTLRRAYGLSREFFETMLKMKMHIGKSEAVLWDKRYAKWGRGMLRAAGVSVCKRAAAVGTSVQVTGRDDHSNDKKIQARQTEAIRRAGRVAMMPGNKKRKARAIGTAVISKVWGTSVTGMRKEAKRKLRGAILKAVWERPTKSRKNQRLMRSANLVMTLVVKGHRQDPEQHDVYAAFKDMIQVLREVPERGWGVLARGWAASCGRTKKTCIGPVTRLRSAVAELGWSWPIPGVFGRGDRRPLPIVMPRECTAARLGMWLHEVREAKRRQLWRTDATRRGRSTGDMYGLENLDRKATQALRDSGEVTPYEQGTLEGIFTGSYRSGYWLFRAGLIPSGNCAFCSARAGYAIRNDHWHLWKMCEKPEIVEVRRRHPYAMQVYDKYEHEPVQKPLLIWGLSIIGIDSPTWKWERIREWRDMPPSTVRADQRARARETKAIQRYMLDVINTEREVSDEAPPNVPTDGVCGLQAYLAKSVPAMSRIEPRGLPHGLDARKVIGFVWGPQLWLQVWSYMCGCEWESEPMGVSWEEVAVDCEQRTGLALAETRRLVTSTKVTIIERGRLFHAVFREITKMVGAVCPGWETRSRLRYGRVSSVLEGWSHRPVMGARTRMVLCELMDQADEWVDENPALHHRGVWRRLFVPRAAIPLRAEEVAAWSICIEELRAAAGGRDGERTRQKATDGVIRPTQAQAQLTELGRQWQDERHTYLKLAGSSSSQKGAHVRGEFRLCTMCWQACRDVQTCVGGGVRTWLRAPCIPRSTAHRPTMWTSEEGRHLAVCDECKGYRSLPRQSQLSTVHEWLRTTCRGPMGASKQWRGRGVRLAPMRAEKSCREARREAVQGSGGVQSDGCESARGRTMKRDTAQSRARAEEPKWRRLTDVRAGAEPRHRKHRGKTK